MSSPDVPRQRHEAVHSNRHHGSRLIRLETHYGGRESASFS